MLRLDWNILFNIINLLLLYWLMKRFLFKPVSEILAKRQAEAEDIFAQAEAKEAKAREDGERYQTLLQEVDSEKNQIVSEARAEASREYGRIVDEAKRRADGIVENAKNDAQKEKSAMLNQADAQIREMVLTAAAKMAGQTAGSENDSRLYNKFLTAQETKGSKTN